MLLFHHRVVSHLNLFGKWLVNAFLTREKGIPGERKKWKLDRTDEKVEVWTGQERKNGEMNGDRSLGIEEEEEEEPDGGKKTFRWWRAVVARIMEGDER